jgi:uncharacterized protein (DUF3084 family)
MREPDNALRWRELEMQVSVFTNVLMAQRAVDAMREGLEYQRELDFVRREELMEQREKNAARAERRAERLMQEVERKEAVVLQREEEIEKREVAMVALVE